MSDVYFPNSCLPYLSSELPDPTLIIDPITEERASRTLYRIELLRRIREQVLPHPQLSERLKLCQPSPDLPEWWECGRHDRDLLLGASKHGVSRTDYHILNDPTLAFLEAHQRFTSQRGANVSIGASLEITKAGMGGAESTSAPLLTPAELASATAAAKIAVNATKEEEVEEKAVKMEDEKAEMVVEMEEGDANNIPCAKIETPDEQKEHEGEIREDKDETAASQSKEIKKEEEVQPKAENEEEEVHKEEQSGEEEKLTNDQDKDLTEEKNGTLGDQKDTLAELQHSSPKVQPAQTTAEEEDGEEKENPESPKSPKSADTEKSPEEEEEERLDEDDKSEKSSQAEGMSEGRVSDLSRDNVEP